MTDDELKAIEGRYQQALEYDVEDDWSQLRDLFTDAVTDVEALLIDVKAHRLRCEQLEKRLEAHERAELEADREIVADRDDLRAVIGDVTAIRFGFTHQAEQSDVKGFEEYWSVVELEPDGTGDGHVILLSDKAECVAKARELAKVKT